MDHVPNGKGQPWRHVENLEGVVKDELFDPKAHVEEALRNEIDLDDELVKKLIRKVDYRLIPPLAFLYAIALVDWNNLPNARLAGLDEELDISKGNRYTLLVMMFFIPYVLFELPANLAMRKVGPAKWLAAIGFLWGVVMIGMGFVHSWGALLGCRVLFGIFEAGLFPGSIYLMSCWYTRYEVQKRFSAFFCVGLFCSEASSLIGYGIQQMQGLAGFMGWRWIFIIEGTGLAKAWERFIMCVDADQD
ncbi:hypothetical protein LTR17_023011 [Elasticomyces elasticus]|nr:hypothetical protein LTR17_023011 [Elasticomyces elasticus]